MGERGWLGTRLALLVIVVFTWQKHMDAWFLRVADIIKKGKISPRIKFMLKDVQELRENGWVPRNVYRVYRIGELKSLKQVRASSRVISLSQTLSSFFYWAREGSLVQFTTWQSVNTSMRIIIVDST